MAQLLEEAPLQDQLRLKAQQNKYEYEFTSPADWQRRIGERESPPPQGLEPASPQDEARLLGVEPASQVDAERLLGTDQTDDSIFSKYGQPVVDYLTKTAQSRMLAAQQGQTPFGQFGEGFKAGFQPERPLAEETTKSAEQFLQSQGQSLDDVGAIQGLVGVAQLGDAAFRSLYGATIGGVKAGLSVLPIDETQKGQLLRDAMVEFDNMMGRAGVARPQSLDRIPVDVGIKPKVLPDEGLLRESFDTVRATETPRPSPPAQIVSPPESTPVGPYQKAIESGEVDPNLRTVPAQKAPNIFTDEKGKQYDATKLSDKKKREIVTWRDPNNRTNFRTRADDEFYSENPEVLPGDMKKSKGLPMTESEKYATAIAEQKGKTPPSPPLSLEKPKVSPTPVGETDVRAKAEQAYNRLIKKGAFATQAKRFDELTPGWDEFIQEPFKKGMRGTQKADIKLVNEYVATKREAVQGTPATAKPKLELVYSKGKGWVSREEQPSVRTRNEPVPDRVDLTTLPDEAFWNTDGTRNLKEPLSKLGRAINEIEDRMGLSKRSQFVIGDFPEKGWSVRHWDKDGNTIAHEIKVNPRHFADERELYGTVAHELGHYIMREKVERASAKIQLAIDDAYANWRSMLAKLPVAEKTFDRLIRTRDSVTQVFMKPSNLHLRQLTPDERAYWLGKDEWFAEQVGKWMTTDKKPLTIAEKHFAGIAKNIIALHNYFAKKFGFISTPTRAVQEFLDSLMNQADSFSYEAQRQFEKKTTALNARSMKDVAKDFPSTPMTEASVDNRQAFVEMWAEPSRMPPEVRAAPAIADKWYSHWKWWRGLTQLADANLHIEPLQRYREFNILMHQRAANGHLKAEVITKDLLKLSDPQRNAFNRLSDEYMNMRYLTDEERAAGVVRRPTAEEFRNMVDGNGVDAQTLAAFNRVVRSYDDFTHRAMDIAKKEVERTITDPAEKARQLANLETARQEYLKKPYAPAMRYGDFSLRILDGNGDQVAFYRVESKRELNKLTRNWRNEARSQGWDPDKSVLPGVMPKSMMPFINLPPHLMDLLKKRLSLTPDQLKALDQLKYEVAPASSFAHRFQKKNLVPGYSKDFVRAYNHYFFHGERYLARAEFMPQLEQFALDLQNSAKEIPDVQSAIRRGSISNYVNAHLNEIKNPSADWSILNAFAFHHFLGFRMKAAAQNLTQTFVSTDPLLSAKFGDVKAKSALSRAATDWNTFWREGSVRGSDAAEMRALAEGIEGGEIKGHLANEIASASEGRNWLRNYGFNKTDKAINAGLRGSSFMFEMSEQANRRVAYMATYRLARENPRAKFVTEAKAVFKQTYNDLIQKGFSPSEASAIVTAKWATRISQGEYAAYARPPLFRKAGRTLFVFGTFKHQMLVNMLNFKDAGVRSLLTYGMLGGMMGLPFAEDIKGIIKAIAWQFFGKDFDLERETKTYVSRVLGNPNSEDTIAGYGPGIATRGIARYGFGIPAVLDTIGEWQGNDNLPVPTVDLSGSVGLGQYLPLDLGEVYGPNPAPMMAAGEQLARSTGALGGLVYNGVKASLDQRPLTDRARWEPIMPSVMKDMSRAARIASQGYETNRLGDKFIQFDTGNPEQLSELVGMSLGFNPTRMSEKWELVTAKREQENVWKIRRGAIMRQLWAAKDDPEEYSRMIQAVNQFNSQLTDETRPLAITAKSIKQSFQSRTRGQTAREKGMPVDKKFIPLYQSIQEQYPNAEVGVEGVD